MIAVQLTSRPFLRNSGFVRAFLIEPASTLDAADFS
jgi:hypothetical protein